MLLMMGVTMSMMSLVIPKAFQWTNGLLSMVVMEGTFLYRYAFQNSSVG